MTPANPDALADALAQTMWEQSFSTLANASWEEAHRIAKAIPDGQAAWNIETVRRKASEIVTLHVAPILAAKEAAEARAAQLQAEVEALKGALNYVKTWIDTDLPAGTSRAGIAHRVITKALDRTALAARAATAREG